VERKNVEEKEKEEKKASHGLERIPIAPLGVSKPKQCGWCFTIFFVSRETTGTIYRVYPNRRFSDSPEIIHART